MYMLNLPPSVRIPWLNLLAGIHCFRISGTLIPVSVWCQNVTKLFFNATDASEKYASVLVAGQFLET
jgi:hypothetical protein